MDIDSISGGAGDDIIDSDDLFGTDSFVSLTGCATSIPSPSPVYAGVIGGGNFSVSPGVTAVSPGVTFTAGTGVAWSNTTVVKPPQYLTASEEEKETVIEIRGKNPVLRTQYGDIRLQHFVEMMSQMANILCSVRANMEQLAEYPALENAYLHYKIIEKLVRETPPKS